MRGQLDSAIVNGTQLIRGSGGKVTTGPAGTWWIDYDAIKPKAQEAYYTHFVNKEAGAPPGLDTTYSWSTSGRGDCYSVYWRGSASVGVTLTTGVTTSHNGIGALSTAALVKSGQVTWSQSSIVQNGEGGTGGGTWKVVHKERCRVCKDEVGMHEHQRLCYGCLEWYECYKHSGNHIEISCPLSPNNQTCMYQSYYKCSPHTHTYGSSGSGSGSGSTPPSGGGSTPPSGSNPPSSPSMLACGVHSSGTSGDHSLQSSCSSSNANGTCTVTSFYACQSHTHVYPPPPPPTVRCGRSACTASVSSSTEHQSSPCAAGDTYYTCNPNVNVSQWQNRHRVRTCRRSGCGNTWQLCQSSTPSCSAKSGKRCSAR